MKFKNKNTGRIFNFNERLLNTLNLSGEIKNFEEVNEIEEQIEDEETIDLSDKNDDNEDTIEPELQFDVNLDKIDETQIEDEKKIIRGPYNKSKKTNKKKK